MQVPFVGGTYGGRSTSIDTSRAVNFYVEAAQDATRPGALVGTPGTELWLRIGNKPIRALYRFGDYLFAISGSTLYRISAKKKVTEVGNLNTSSGPVLIEDNGISERGVGGNQMLIVDGTYGYIYNYLSNTLEVHNSPNFPTPVKAISYMDGYFIVSSGNMGITTSELYDGTNFNGLAIAAAIASPDNIKAVLNIHQQLFIVKEYSTEVWYNTGIATQDGSPFARVNGAVMDYGTIATHAVARGDNALFFLANQRQGSGSGAFVGVAKLEGYKPIIISPPAITYKISNMDVESAEAYCYSAEGHTFYVLTFPKDNCTLVYDITNQMWHERSTYSTKRQVKFDNVGKPTAHSILPFQVNRHLSSCYVNYKSQHLVGDYRTGNIYEMSSRFYSDNGEPIVSIRTSGILYDEGDARNIFISKVQVEGQMGVGDQQITPDELEADFIADGTVRADGSEMAGTVEFKQAPSYDPQAFLSWSNDSGMTWSNEYVASMGKCGEYNNRLIWRRIGAARNRVFRLRISAPVKKILTAAYLEG